MPEDISVRPSIIRIVVVLPAPFGPSRPNTSPLAMSKLMRIDDVDLAVTLGETPRRDDDLVGRRGGLLSDAAHRRPNLATAPSISSSATPITPAPAIPHTVEVATVMRNWPDAFSPRDVARTVVM